jgi:hypothetical protein
MKETVAFYINQEEKVCLDCKRITLRICNLAKETENLFEFYICPDCFLENHYSIKNKDIYKKSEILKINTIYDYQENMRNGSIEQRAEMFLKILSGKDNKEERFEFATRFVSDIQAIATGNCLLFQLNKKI